MFVKELPINGSYLKMEVMGFFCESTCYLNALLKGFHQLFLGKL